MVSVMTFLFILLSAVQPAEGINARGSAGNEFNTEEGILRKKLKNLVFALEVLLCTPGILTPAEIAEDIREQFLLLVVDEEAIWVPEGELHDDIGS